MVIALVMQVDIWSGDWGLPSIDSKCLQTMTYAKFSGAPLKIRKTNNPWKSPTGYLPVFLHGQFDTYTKFDEVTYYLQKQNYNADYELSNVQKSDVKAYISVLEEKLQPALLYIWWVDAKNYVELTRPWYAKMLPFHQNYFVPGRYQKKALQKIVAMYGITDVEDKNLELMLYKDAQECLTMLSNRLANKEFFFGKSPTSLDATVFAYLAPLLKAPFPNAALQNHLRQCDNLVRFIERVLKNYFPLTPEESEKVSSITRSRTGTELEFPNRRRNQIMCALFAIFAMIGYAFSSGLVQVEIVDDGRHDRKDVDDSSDDES